MPSLQCLLVFGLVVTATPPLTLDDAVGLALVRHPSARVADADRALALQKLRTAELAAWPSLDLQSGALYTTSRDGTPAFVANNAPIETRAQVVARVPFDTGQLSASRRQAQLEAASAEFGAQAAKATLALGVGQAYFDELRAERNVEATVAARSGAELQRKATAAQLGAGKVAKLELRRAEAAVASYDATLAAARADLASARRRFRDLTGAPADFRLTEPPAPPPPGPSLAVPTIDARQATRTGQPPREFGLPQVEPGDPIGNRPDVRQAETDLAAREAELEVTQLARRPQVSATSIAGWDTGGAPSPGNLGASYGVDLSWPLWDAGRQGVLARSAEIGIARAHYAAQVTRLAARADLEDARAALAKAQGQYQAQSRARAVADEALAMARVGFREGAVPGLELLNAQQAAFAARLAQQNAIYDYYQAASKLHWAAGVALP